MWAKNKVKDWTLNPLKKRLVTKVNNPLSKKKQT